MQQWRRRQTRQQRRRRHQQSQKTSRQRCQQQGESRGWPPSQRTSWRSIGRRYGPCQSGRAPCSTCRRAWSCRKRCRSCRSRNRSRRKPSRSLPSCRKRQSRTGTCRSACSCRKKPMPRLRAPPECLQRAEHPPDPSPGHRASDWRPSGGPQSQACRSARPDPLNRTRA